MRYSIAERPVFLRHLDEIDQDVFFAQFERCVQAVGHCFVKALLHLDRSTTVERDLHKYALVGPVDAKIIPIKLQAGFGVGSDDPEQVVFWDIQNVR